MYARALLYGFGVLTLSAADGCTGSDQSPQDRDAGRWDAAMTVDAQVVDASNQVPNDSGAAGDADGGSGARDAGAVDAGMKQDAAAERDAASRDSGTVAQDAGREGGTLPDDDEDSGAPDAGEPISEDTFAMRVLATGLDAPWEITWGPDDHLWITERGGWRIVRMDPASGDVSTAFDVPDVFQESGQDGVLGMALDTRLGKALGADYVYLAYTYDADPSEDVDQRAKIVRLAYNAQLGTLGSLLTLIDGLPASGDHNSGRLIYGPDNYLYYTIGDQGHNQFDNKCLPNRAQDLPTQNDVDTQNWSAYQGKILRLSLDGSIPAANPAIGGVRSHIYSYGHRNAQGIAFGPDGKLYASEQGPKTDDEINLIVAGKNYGWPHVAGYLDDSAYVYSNWSASSPDDCTNLSYSDYDVPDAVPKQLESAWSHPDYTSPLRTFYTVDNDFDFINLPCADDYFVCWPTVAPSSLDIYVPGEQGLKSWGNALLVPSLKLGSVLRVRLSANGEATEGEPKELFKTTNRYRDLAIAPSKRTFYIITDSYGATSGPTSTSTQQLEHRGAVLEFTYTAQP